VSKRQFSNKMPPKPGQQTVVGFNPPAGPPSTHGKKMFCLDPFCKTARGGGVVSFLGGKKKKGLLGMKKPQKRGGGGGGALTQKNKQHGRGKNQGFGKTGKTKKLLYRTQGCKKKKSSRGVKGQKGKVFGTGAFGCFFKHKKQKVGPPRGEFPFSPTIKTREKEKNTWEGRTNKRKTERKIHQPKWGSQTNLAPHGKAGHPPTIWSRKTAREKGRRLGGCWHGKKRAGKLKFRSPW